MSITHRNALPLLSPELTKLYEPVSVVGYGAFAMVVKAIDRATGRMVAIKHFQTTGGQRKKYFQELKFIMRLNHPHIVRCLDVSSADEDTSDLVLEYAEGGSLRERLFENVPIAVEDAISILNQVTRGLVHAHAQGIVHRDMKPENMLMFAREGMPATGTEQLRDWHFKISDFGIAKYIGPQSKTMTSIGSPAYMAPEQFYDEYDLKSDIYASGAILFELLHGRVPFDGSPAVIFKGHLEQMPTLRPDLPENVKGLLLRMMDKKPANRPSAEELGAQLEAMAGGAPAPAQAPKPGEVAPRPLSFADIGAVPVDVASSPKPASKPSDESSSDVATSDEESDEQADTMNEPAEGAAPRPGPMAGSATPPAAGKIESPEAKVPPPTTSASAGALSAPTPQPAPRQPATPKPPSPRLPPAKLPSAVPRSQGHSSSSAEVSRLTPPMPSLRDVIPDSRDPAADAEAIALPGDSDFGLTAEQRRQRRLKEAAEERARHAARAPHSMFDDAFGASRGEAVQVPVNLSELNKRAARRVGRLTVAKAWSRAIDSKCKRLVNLGGGDKPIVLASDDALSTLKSNGGRGDQFFVGAIEFLGTASVGNLAFVSGGHIRLVHGGQVLGRTWDVAPGVAHLIFSPSRDGIAMTINGEVSYHDSEGESLWSGRLDEGGNELFLAFDTSDRLMVAALGSDDCAVRFYSRDGEELASHLMPGRITGSARSMNGIGAWLVVDTEEGPMMTWVSAEGVASAVLIDRPLTQLVGGADWVCGRDAEGRLWIVDPASSTLSLAEVQGAVIDYELGFSPNQLLVLEQRGEVMRYITAYDISMKTEPRK